MLSSIVAYIGAFLLGLVYVPFLLPALWFAALLVLSVFVRGGVRALLMSRYYGLVVFSYGLLLVVSLLIAFGQSAPASGFGLLSGGTVAMATVREARRRGGLPFIQSTIRDWWSRTFR